MRYTSQLIRLVVISIFFLFAMTNCNNDDEDAFVCLPDHVTTLDPDEVAYIDVPQGSYWVFKDSASGQIDTLRLCNVDCFKARVNCDGIHFDTRVNYYDSSAIFGGRFHSEAHYATLKNFDSITQGDTTVLNYIIDLKVDSFLVPIATFSTKSTPSTDYLSCR